MTSGLGLWTISRARERARRGLAALQNTHPSWPNRLHFDPAEILCVKNERVSLGAGGRSARASCAARPVQSPKKRTECVCEESPFEFRDSLEPTRRADAKTLERGLRSRVTRTCKLVGTHRGDSSRRRLTLFCMRIQRNSQRTAGDDGPLKGVEHFPYAPASNGSIDSRVSFAPNSSIEGLESFPNLRSLVAMGRACERKPRGPCE